MSQTVREWMSSPVIFVDADSTVAQALTLMRRRNIHSLMVALSGADFGIVTTTDIRDKIVGIERDPKATVVREIMTTPVVTAHPDMTLRDCSLRMKEKGVHHLPVADQRGMIVGMISANDIFAAIEEMGWAAL
ncbi:MAG: CBS domain-containing protein [Anaerolineae bacterium]|jgi:CBS domain-containing protein|nr:CBS domain-containing protein [Anaerolineae bacterium]